MAERTRRLKNDWKITTQRYVAFFDIMGFKDMVARSKHEEIYEMMKQVNELKNISQNTKWGGSEELLVQSTFFSDSIILYSKDDTNESANAIVSTISSITNDLLTYAIPHKGALAFGRMTMDQVNSIYFGQPLIDAYLLQEELSLYCVVVHASAENEFYIKSHPYNRVMYEYQCPFKGGSSTHLTIPPIYTFALETFQLIDMEQMIHGVKKLRLKTSGHLRKYIDNTEVYLNKMRELIIKERNNDE